MERFGSLVVALVGAAAVTAQVLLSPDGLDQPVLLAIHVAAWIAAVVLSVLLTRRVKEAGAAARRARAAIDLLDDAVVVVDAEDHRVRYANLAAARLAARPADAVIGLRLWDTGPWPPVEDLVALVEEEREFVVLEHRGTTYRVAATRVVWEGERAYVVRSRDITERELAQRDLAVRERRFRALAQNVAGIVYRIRLQPELELEFVNDHLRTVLGYQPTEWFLDPELLSRLVRPEHRDAVDLTGDEHVYGEEGVHAYEVRHADGHWLWVEDHHTPERDEDGVLVAVQGIVFDVTQQREAEQALGEAMHKQELAAETLHRTARVEQTLLQSISHELRTPMTSAIGFARMLAEKAGLMSPEQQATMLERLVANIERIEGLIGRMVEFDRFTRGDVEIERSLERLDDLVQGAISRVDLGERTVETRLGVVAAQVDRRRIEQAVEALLRNVAMHTPETATVRVSVTSYNDVSARIVVEDDGPGVAASIAETVFEPFTQGPDSKDTANPGVGLGLAMVRMSARLHEGDAHHEEVVPRGSRFVLWLPMITDEDTVEVAAS